MKYILKLKNSTPNYIVYGELGMMPLKIDIYKRMISYWGGINSHELNINEMRSCIYNATRSYYNHNNITHNTLYFKWIHCIKNILCNCGLSGILESHTFPNQK